MQSNLDAISHWSSETELFFNESKIDSIPFWAKPSSINLPQYTINDKINNDYIYTGKAL